MDNFTRDLSNEKSIMFIFNDVHSDIEHYVVLNETKNYLAIKLGDMEKHTDLSHQETLMLKDIFNRMITPPQA